MPNSAWNLVKALDTLRSDDGEVLIDGFYDNVREPSENEIEAVREIPFYEEEKKRFGIKHFLNNLEGEPLKRKHFLEPACNICWLESGWTGEGSKTVLSSEAIAKVGFRLVSD